MLASQVVTTQIFEVRCNHCKKIRKVHIIDGLVGKKDLDGITCQCGSKIPIGLLKYLFRGRESIESDLLYFIC